MEVVAADAVNKRDHVDNVDGSDGISSVTRPAMHTNARTSSSSVCNEKCENDPMISNLRERIAQLTGTRPEYAEPFGVVKYQPGEFYSVHHDFGDEDAHRPMSGRILTLLIYLSDPESDDKPRTKSADGFGTGFFDPQNGETFFPALNISVPPRKYSALLWSNVAELPTSTKP